jgi:hypothetical protein
MSTSADPTSLVCQCEAGFEPSSDNAICVACGFGMVKGTVGNHACKCDAGHDSHDVINILSSAVLFPSSGDYISIPTSPSSVFMDSMAFTVEVWFKAASSTPASFIVLKNAQWGIKWMGHNQALGYYCGSNYSAAAPTNVRAGVWTHAAIVATSSGLKTMYLNGQVEIQAASRGTNSYSGSPFPIEIGAWSEALQYFTGGEVAEVRIWNTVRSGNQLSSANNLLPVKPSSSLVGYWTFSSASSLTIDTTGVHASGTVSGKTAFLESAELKGSVLYMINGEGAQHKDALRYDQNVNGMGDLSNTETRVGAHKMSEISFDAFRFTELKALVDGNKWWKVQKCDHSAFTAAEAFGVNSQSCVNLVAWDGTVVSNKIGDAGTGP